MTIFRLSTTALVVSFLFLSIPCDVFAQDLSRLIGTQTMLIRHQATEHQRKVAEQRARAYVASVRRTVEASKTEKKVTSKASPQEASSTKVVKAKGKSLPRFIAVDTEKDKQSPAKTKKAVMIWDTHAEALVGNNVYDLEIPPAVGSTAKFETYSAQYVASGNW